MKGDFTQNTFRREKHYSSVRMQQGRVQLDADWNEQADIQNYRRRVADRDLIGVCGGPKGIDSQGNDLAGFEVLAEADQLRVTSGRYYVDGILCENEQDLLIKRRPGPEPVLGATEARFPTQAGTYLVYLDVWERHVTAEDDVEIREVALGGADTATRTEVVWEVRMHKGKVTPGTRVDCDTIAEWMPERTLSTGQLKARLHRAGAEGGPCNVAGGSYRRLENQLYRVEVHKGGNRMDATFKWSRDNGSIVARWTGEGDGDGTELTLGDATPRQLQGFHEAPWIEVIDEARERRGKRGVLARVLNVKGNKLIIDPNTIQDPDDPNADHIDRNAFPANPKVRRWDSEAALATKGADGKPWIKLEEDIQVQFRPGRYRAGDYWLIPARTLIDDVLWLGVAAGNNPAFRPPDGIEHHTCPLALVEVTAHQVRVTDCRKLFPPATAITADDVSFDNTHCQMKDARTVQEALDVLCQQNKAGCTLVAIPGPGWEQIFDCIPRGADAHVCFQAGDYANPSEAPVTVLNKGHIKITGCGPGTRIVATKAEAALAFIGCSSVTVRDLHAEARVTGIKGKKKHLNGALCFINCPQVTVENVTLKCAAGTRRSSTCITVRNGVAAAAGSAKHGRVRIRHNDLRVGHEQTGILLINVARVHVEDNTLSVTSKPKSLTLEKMLRDKVVRMAVRRALVSDITAVDVAAITAGRPLAAVTGELAGLGHSATFATGNFAVGFRTANKALAAGLQKLLAKYTPDEVVLHSSTDLVRHTQYVLDRLLMHPERLVEAGAVAKWYQGLKSQNPAVASQGIVVGGQAAEDVRIVNNTIFGVRQGIHVGQSRRLADRTPQRIDRTERLQIAGNTITVLLPLLQLAERHGIF